MVMLQMKAEAMEPLVACLADAAQVCGGRYLHSIHQEHQHIYPVGIVLCAVDLE
jgi:hypothetical protein